MKAKVAVATVQGKAYFLIVEKLRERNIPFVSLIPGEPVPAEVKVVITTKKERQLINHDKVLVYNAETEPDMVVNEALKALEGKESYEKIVIGIDPGDVFGLAVIADGKVNETTNAFSVQEVLAKTRGILKHVDVSATRVSVKIGSGVPIYRELLEALDAELPLHVVLEIVSEAGTNLTVKDDKHRRGLRDIASAIRIAGRTGRIIQRRQNNEPDS
ncbi:hypothetical protein G4O51_02250 [Candidatus Bathyarchaeota archaeon A05DMB-2]|jgi:hypothetical protein|nr:hypothetical protein [Candidatus Bathyarchaeota archaeon A05DMB-2]